MILLLANRYKAQYIKERVLCFGIIKIIANSHMNFHMALKNRHQQENRRIVLYFRTIFVHNTYQIFILHSIHFDTLYQTRTIN